MTAAKKTSPRPTMFKVLGLIRNDWVNRRSNRHKERKAACQRAGYYFTQALTK